MSEDGKKKEKPPLRIILSSEGGGVWTARFIAREGKYITIRDMRRLARTLKVGFREYQHKLRLEKRLNEKERREKDDD